MGEKSASPFLFSRDPAAEHDASALIVHVPPGLIHKRALLACYADRLRFSYFGWNWDALVDCLRDLSWIEESSIVVIHRDVPLTGTDQKIYLSVLTDVIGEQADKTSQLFTVMFPEDCKDKVRLLQSGS
jgi:hypothetical protein